MVKYVFRDGIPPIIQNRDKANPQRIGAAIEKARKETLPGEDVRERLEQDARNKRHALHPHLEWDDSIAARKYRLEQINDLIRLVAVETEDGGQRPAFISIASTNTPRAFYSPGEILRSTELQDAALKAAERDLDAFVRRHRWIEDICAEVVRLRDKVRERREAARASSDAAA